MNLSKKLEGKHPIGAYPESNFGGLVFFKSDDPDYDFITAYDFGSGIIRARHTNVLYDDTGRPFVRRYGIVYYLDEVLNLNI